MSDQPTLPGLTPAQLRTQERLLAIAREIRELDIRSLCNAVPGGTPEEELAVAAADFQRRLRQCGVFAHLAMLAHAERVKAEGGA